MANIKSAKKRIKVIDRQKAENKFVKATIATYTKKFRALVEEGKFDEAEAKLKETISLIDSAESKGILHKNNASRKVGRLSYALAKARFEAKPVEEVEEKPAKTEAKVEEVKEVPVAKKAPAKKTTAKKAEVAEEKPAKKAPAKKTTAKKAEVAEEKPAKKATKTVAKKETKAEEKPAKKTATKKTAKAE
ncbi:MAG: 30S ribosomal protein S20 [Firmicutes bacterium]|nr:30S ribosomal protein S20 [Bacillota bacterium]